MTPKYPNVTVELVGQDGNAFSIISRVKSALNRSKDVPGGEGSAFVEEAMSGDYNHLLQTVMKWVNVGGEHMDEEYEDEDDDEICPYCGDDYDNCYCDEDEYFEESED